MQIPLFSVYNPSGENEYLLTSLSGDSCNSILSEAKQGTAQVVANHVVSPFLGLTFRSQDIQVFSYVSCTGWLIFVGFENGPFNGMEVADSLFERVYNALIQTVSNPFYSKLEDSKFFHEQVHSALQSHSVMMTFMASSHVLGMPKRVDLPIPFQLAASWSPDLKRDISNWMVSEKLDGVRAMWDGRGNLLSRNGHKFNCPRSFIESLPKGVILDGELWIDRGMFEDVVSVIRTRPDDWKLITYKVFDIYSKIFRHLPFEARMHHCGDILRDQPDFIHIHRPHTLETTSLSCIQDQLASILKAGGEGLVLRDPQAVYTPGRQSARLSPILKVKPYLDDEAEVIEVNLRNGRKGSILARDSFGKIFKIGSGFKDVSVEPPPPVGSIISFAYTSRNQSTGIPRFPRYIRKRLDYDLN